MLKFADMRGQDVMIAQPILSARMAFARSPGSAFAMTDGLENCATLHQYQPALQATSNVIRKLIIIFID